MSERTYNGRTYAQHVAILGKEGADNYISWFSDSAATSESVHLLRVGDRVAVSESLLKLRFPGWNSGRLWSLGRVVEINEGDNRYGNDGTVKGGWDVPWLVSLPEVGVNVSVGLADIEAGWVMLCLEGEAAIEAHRQNSYGWPV